MDEPSEQLSFDLDCVTCEGRDPACSECPDCGGTGLYRLTRCPQADLPEWVIEFCELYGYVADGGHWPVAGGVLDQTQAFLDGVRFMRGEDARLKANFRAQDDH